MMNARGCAAPASIAGAVRPSKPDMFADPFATRQGNDGCGLDAVFGSPGGRADTQRGVRPDLHGDAQENRRDRSRPDLLSR